jgi:DNA-binding transcriptional LysR family regulator
MADLGLIQTFVTVYRVGNMTAAARLLHLTQPAVSKQVQAFEAQVQRTLFTRLARGIAPTAAAHSLAHMLSPHLDAIEAALAAQAVGPGALAGTVLIGGPTEFLGTRVLPALHRVREHDIAIRAQAGMPRELLDALTAGALDLAITTQRLPTRGIRFESLYTEEFVLVGAAHWADRLPPAAIAERGAPLFADVPIIAYDDALPIVRRYWRAVFGVAPPARTALLVPDLRSVAQAAAAGLGVTVLPSYLVTEALQRGTLVSLFPAATSPTNTLWLASRVGAVTPRIAFVLETLRRASLRW